MDPLLTSTTINPYFLCIELYETAHTTAATIWSSSPHLPILGEGISLSFLSFWDPNSTFPIRNKQAGEQISTHTHTPVQVFIEIKHFSFYNFLFREEAGIIP